MLKRKLGNGKIKSVLSKMVNIIRKVLLEEQGCNEELLNPVGKGRSNEQEQREQIGYHKSSKY
jgi:hypothetical protein